MKFLRLNLPARIGVRRMAPSGMPNSSSLPYHAAFRYTRPAKDLQATFGAQTGNPQVVRVENAKAGKAPVAGKKRPGATAGKSRNASKPKAAKPAASKPKVKAKAKTKTKKPAGKR